MPRRTIVLLAAVIPCLTAFALEQQPAPVADPPLVNWTAPPYWSPSLARTAPEPGLIDVHALDVSVEATSLPSSPVPFVAIAPCRIVDTRVSDPDGFHAPNFADNETRTFNFPASTGCPGLPVDSVAYSVNVQFRPISLTAYITLFPTGTSRPAVSTIIGTTAAWTTDAAIVPAGTGGAIDVYCQFAGRVVIDVNGYYETEDVVNTLNALTGEVTLAAGSNVTITPGGNTLTIATTGGPGGVLPTGTTGQTLYDSGSAWTASSALTNDGTNVGISGNLLLPGTISGGAAGVLFLGSDRFLHNYGPSGAGNTFIGQQAGNFTMGGVGSQGKSNTGIGFQSLHSNTTGGYNTATGNGSLASNTTGNFNTADGELSLSSNTTGNSNTANGYNSLGSNTSGYGNTAYGSQSLDYNTMASRNTAVGANALMQQSFDNGGTAWASWDTAVGYGSLSQNQPTSATNGFQNTAVGGVSMAKNTTGSDNAATGYYSLYANTTADYNTAVGAFALGSQSFSNSDTEWQSYNTAVGYNALYTNNPDSTSDGIQNTAVGANALASNTTGYSNTAAGFGAGGTTTEGSYNTFLGSAADAASGALTNATAIGYAAQVDTSNKVRIGNTSVTVIEGQVAFTYTSDARLKEKIRDLDLGLDFLMQLRPVSFTMRQGNGRTDMGFLAQEVEAVLGDGYNVLGIGADQDRTLSLRGTDLIAPLVKAVQEQQATIQAQQAQIEAKDARIAALESQQMVQKTRIDALERTLAAIEARMAAR